jgi:hypothetical protein
MAGRAEGEAARIKGTFVGDLAQILIQALAQNTGAAGRKFNPAGPF